MCSFKYSRVAHRTTGCQGLRHITATKSTGRRKDSIAKLERSASGCYWLFVLRTPKIMRRFICALPDAHSRRRRRSLTCTIWSSATSESSYPAKHIHSSGEAATRKVWSTQLGAKTYISWQRGGGGLQIVGFVLLMRTRHVPTFPRKTAKEMRDGRIGT